MNIVNLRTFLAIVETGSLVRASDRLNVTQSTVTVRLKALEEDLGQRLMMRQKSGVSLTSAGRRFHRYAEGITDLWRQARQDVSLPDEVESIFNLACHIDLWPSIGKTLVDTLWTHYPSTAISAWHGNVSDIEDWLTTGLSNAALCHQPLDREGLSPHRLPDEQLILVSDRPDTPMRFDPGYVYVDAGEDFGRRHAAAYTDAGTARTNFGSAAWAHEHLVTRGGSAYLPERLVRKDLAEAVLWRIDDAPSFTRAVYLVTRDSEAEKWPWLNALIDTISR